MLQAMPPAQQIGIPLAGFCGVAFMMSAVQAMGANVSYFQLTHLNLTELSLT